MTLRRLAILLLLLAVSHRAAASDAPAPAAPGPALTIAAADTGFPISPHIYGINFADPALVAELGLGLVRWGGNATTRYNWQLDTSNRASDWFFENIPNDVPVSQLPESSTANGFVSDSRGAGADVIMTMPLIGWTPKDRTYAGCSFRVSVYGAQQSTDPWAPDCGNGRRPDGSLITGNNPNDASTPIDESFVTAWVNHLSSLHGSAAQGGVRFYSLDNEPMLWNSTHRDVYPAPASYDELRNRTLQYAAAIKGADPTAQTLGPVVWGWTAYFYSALDVAAGGAWWQNPLDRNAHGGTPFIPWYLQQMAAYEQQHGSRLLDYLDLHYYPQAPGVTLSNDTSSSTQALRLRSTRALWDPTYVDESWIGEPVRLLPRMREWVDQNYPGTRLALTEYNWGAFGHINGALAQADVLGIFGREGLDLATLWVQPDSEDPVAYAFRMYRNYNGAGGRFGELSVHAASGDQGALAIYAARRGQDGALTVMIINKTGSSLSSAVALDGFSPGGSAEVYRYSAANPNSIVQLANLGVAASGFSATFTANSITLLVLPPGSPPHKHFLPATGRS